MSVVRLAHAVGDASYHLVWCTKYRHKVLVGEVKKECVRVLDDIGRRLGYLLHELTVEADHVHLVVTIPPRVSVSEAFRRLKGASSRILRKRFPEMVRKYFWGSGLWSPGKFFRSIGDVTREMVKAYLRDSHHQGWIPPVTRAKGQQQLTTWT